jgi:hypothetical protein
MRPSLASIGAIFSLLWVLVGRDLSPRMSISPLAPQPAAGCPAAINFGDTLLCSLTTPGEVNSFSFSASANDRVIVRMGRRTSGVNPRIQLQTSGGTPVCEAYSYGNAVDIANCLLTSAGSYTILASNYNSAATGSYSLALQRLNNPANATTLSFGQIQLATLGVAGALDTYTFIGVAGDSVLARMGSGVSGLTPHLRVYRPDGTSLCENYSYAEALDISACLLPSSGQYTLIVSDYSGVDTGSYGVAVQRLNNPGATDAIAFGQTKPATISAPGEIDTYSFSAAAQDTVVVRMGSATSGFTPHIRVYGSDGVKLCEVYTYNPAISTSACLLPSDGTYTLLVNDYNGADTGSYGLSLQRVNSPDQAQQLVFGQLKTADLTVSGELATYTFAAKSGDIVLLRMGGAASGIYPQIWIFAPDGTAICNANGYPAATELPGCILPSSGNYTVLINDYNHSTTGSYGLTIQRLNQPGGATPLLINQNVSAAITAPGAVATYTFVGKANNPVRVRMSSSSGGVYPSIRLYGPDGVLLCQASGYPGVVEIGRCVLPSDATYTLIATNYNGAGSGNYYLSVLCLSSDCGPAIQLSYVYLPFVRH